MAVAREPRPVEEALRKITVSLTPAQVAALPRAVFVDSSARSSAEKNAAEGAVRALQTEIRRGQA